MQARSEAGNPDDRAAERASYGNNYKQFIIMKPISKRCILALSLDWQGFGFVVFDGQDDLLDYGTRNFRYRTKIPFEAKLLLLLDASQPDALVVVEPTTAKRKKIMKKIAKVAKAEKIPLKFISNEAIRKALAPENQNKYQIATKIADRYPELLLRLPSPRETYDSEKFGITIFEATAAAFAYYGQKITPSES